VFLPTGFVPALYAIVKNEKMWGTTTKI